MDQSKTPLFTGLMEHARRNPVQFHIPGHKKGAGMYPEFYNFIGKNALSIDLINIAPLDDLHHPKGIIKEAQELAAEAFGADYTFFSVQGTSGAIMAMIMSVVGPGEKIIIPRNVHKSILSAIIFSGAIPVFIHPVMDANLGIAHGVTTNAVRKALEQNPTAKGLLVINPTYFGVSANLKEIVEVAHSFDVPVLVDEAHGVHIHFHEKMPMSAMQAGADIAATSVHKLGGSMTQSSILNVREGRISANRVKSVISMLTTTSTSYLLLASLDTARKQLVTYGREMMEKVIDLATFARDEINVIPGLYCVGKEILGSEATYNMDPSKLIIQVRGLGLTGHQAEVWLRQKYNIEVELSDLYNILCIITPGDTILTVSTLVQALRELARIHMGSESARRVDVHLPEIPELALSPREAFYAETEYVLLEEAANRIMAEFVMVYPPGIPILLPGEVISMDNINYIIENIKAGLPVQGPEDESLKNIKVIKQSRAIK